MKRSLAIKSKTTQDILELMNGSIYAAVLVTAMECRLEHDNRKKVRG